MTRSVRPEWYDKFGWINVCEVTGKVFCHICQKQDVKKRLNLSTKRDEAFSLKGFNSWAKAHARFRTHESSNAHREACAKLHSETQQPIDAALQGQMTVERTRRGACLIKEIETLIFLLRQNLAIRGKDDSEGNFNQLLALRQKDAPMLRQWEKYLSPTIQNELIEEIGNSLLRRLLSDIREAKFFGIISDETTDAAGKEQV